MIEVTKLYFSGSSQGHSVPFRAYALSRPSGCGCRSSLVSIPGAPRGPVVVWEATRTCNLRCLHCYSESGAQPQGGELSTANARAMFEDLAQFGVRSLVLAGGEPILRPDLPDLIADAHERGLRVELWTNGTLLTSFLADRLAQAGLDEVAISFDGLGWMGDQFRGRKGAFESALRGFHVCREAGLLVGMRFTLTKRTYSDLEPVCDLVERERVPRVCFDHLLYGGRGNDPREDDLSHEESRHAMDLLFQRARRFYRRGLGIEIATTNNLADGIYLCLKLAESDPERATEVYQRLTDDIARESASGVGIAGIDSWGDVHPHPHWSRHSLGNVQQRPFSEIWTDLSNPLQAGLRNPLPRLKGRCATCRCQAACWGNSRARAERVYGDPWMQDPACYLNNEEISREVPKVTESLEHDVHFEEKAA